MSSKFGAPEQNHLAGETSPYLLQHKENPVHWWPWGEEAFRYAKETGKPVLLSVGYAACHWCHVMAHESFEDEATAKVMNELFVNIKVDREERPDVDALYMRALQSLEGHGGWPLTMFLTPDGEPFWGGTYFPNASKYGRPAFTDVLKEVARVYREESDKVAHNTALLRQALEPRGAAGDTAPISLETIRDLAGKIAGVVDPVNGGLQGAPKFPNTSIFALLWRAGLRFDIEICRRAVLLTLTQMSQGGIYDHLGGGFARYTVDDRWLVPHFEKMLYDNAQILDLLAEAWKETREPLYAARVAATIEWIEREMIVPGDGFASSLDADSEGVEGKYYVWDYSEVINVLGPDDADLFTRIYDVTPEGNWEGKNILNRLKHPEALSDAEEAGLAEMRRKLFASRETRVRPGWDDKVLADWNGLMVAALVRAGSAFEKAEWIEMGRRAYDFVKANMGEGDRLWHSYRDGQTSAPGVATDYGNMITAALALFSRTGEQALLDDARQWAAALDRHFWSDDYGGYYLSADDTGDVIIRTLNAHDDSTPNANAVMADNFMALFLLTGDQAYEQKAHAIEKAFRDAIAQNPVAHAGFVQSLMSLIEPQHITIMAPGGEEADELRKTVDGLSVPGAVVQSCAEERSKPANPALSGKVGVDDAPTAYVCIGPQCSLPVTSAERLRALLLDARKGRLTPGS
ncbi:MAG: thioredoxin domain-containing protein [Dichotomicrobium sp.]